MSNALWSQFLVATVAETAGSTIQGAAGFGINLVAVPVLVLINPLFVPGPTLLMNLLLCVAITIRDRMSVDRRVLPWGMYGRLPGSLLGALLVAAISRGSLTLAAAVLILVAIVLSVRRVSVPVTDGSNFVAGCLAGLMSTTASIGGPPLALLYQHRPGPTVRGILAVHGAVGSALSIGFLAAVGKFGVHDVMLGTALLPGLLLGFVLSAPVARKVDAGYMRTAAITISGTAALVILIRAGL